MRYNGALESSTRNALAGTQSTETINNPSQEKAETTVYREAFDGMDQVYFIMDKGDKDAQRRQRDIQVENQSSYQVRDGKIQQVK